MKKKRPSHSAISHSVSETSPPPFDSQQDVGKSRAYSACKACRVKKVKCLPGEAATRLGDPPGACSQCIAGSSECVYPPTRDRAAYSRQYVQNLEGRVQALEAIQNRMMPLIEAYEEGEGLMSLKKESDGERLGENPGSQRPQPRQSQYVNHDEREDEGSNQGGDDGDPDAEDFGQDHGQMTQDEHGNYRWIGASNTLSLLDSFTPTSPHNRPIPNPDQPPRNGTNPYFAPVAGSGVINVLPTVDEVMYPEPEAAEEMIDAYFREIHPILPIMIETEFREAYAALCDRRAKGVPETSGMVSQLKLRFTLARPMANKLIL